MMNWWTIHHIASAYGSLHTLKQPQKPKDKSFDEILEILWRHFELMPVFIPEWFLCCQQKQRVFIMQFMSRLKHGSIDCIWATARQSTWRLLCLRDSQYRMQNQKSEFSSECPQTEYNSVFEILKFGVMHLSQVLEASIVLHYQTG